MLFYKYMDGECKVLALLVYRHPALEDEVLTVDDTDGADTGDAVEDIPPEGCLVPGPGLGGLDLCDYLVGVQHVLIVLRSYLHYYRTSGDIVGGEQALGVREAERHCQFLGLAAFRHYVKTHLLEGCGGGACEEAHVLLFEASDLLHCGPEGIAAECGVGIAGNDVDDKSLEFASNFGLAFQIRDDLLNIKNSDTTKSASDLEEGIYNAPVILADNINDGIEKTKDLLNNYVNCAKLCIDDLGNSIYKKSLIELLELLEDV